MNYKEIYPILVALFLSLIAFSCAPEKKENITAEKVLALSEKRITEIHDSLQCILNKRNALKQLPAVIKNQSNTDSQKQTDDTKSSQPTINPHAEIHATKMNVLYDGVENPVEISVPGIPTDRLVVSISNASYKKIGNRFIVCPKPGSAGRKCIISVSAKTDQGMKTISKEEFRIKRVPNPVAILAGKREGKIRKNRLMAEAGLYADMGEDFDFDLKFNITRFNISIIKGGYLIDSPSKSYRFTREQRELMKGLSLGSKIIIDNIRAVGPDKIPRNLGSLSFTID